VKGRARQTTLKLTALILIPIIALSFVGLAHSHWRETIRIQGTVTTGRWKACVRIQKTLEGAFTNPETGEDITEPTDLIAISASFPTKFKLTIEVKNCESTRLTEVVVTDTILTNVAPIDWTASKGTVSWIDEQPKGEPGEFIFNKLTWTIRNLNPGKSASLVIWIETLQNPTGKYEPTSGDEGDGQDLEINEGAKVTAESLLSSLSATTGGITIHIVDDDVEGNGIGRIDTELPCSTGWAEDRYP